MKRGLLRLTALGLLALILVITLGTTAFAHAAYKDSDPADESNVAQAPSEIWAEYTEPPSEGSYLRVFDPCDEQVDHGDSRPEGYRVYITLSSNRVGTYRVEWFVDSSLDNHPTRGTFTFTTTDGEPCPEAEAVRQKETREREVVSDRNDRSGQAGEVDNDEGVSDAQVSESDNRGSGSNGVAGQGKSARAMERTRDGSSEENDPLAGEDPSSGDANVPEEPGLLSGIPIGGLVIALSLAALIGAAGGFIYAGIMGYHRVSH